MITALGFLTCVLGLAGLSLAMDRYHRQVADRTPSSVARLWLRGVGVAGLASSFSLCVTASGWGTGMVVWFGMATVAALTVALVLSYRPLLLRVGKR
ncbi:DUF3325 domain-containing protein [Vreelandella alkaliphila]|uniref:DUF3325 domain-containing protein n=1 Tax=Vreelandella alkaliphila TaxID=272774 RepID=UPI003F9CC90B